MARIKHGLNARKVIRCVGQDVVLPPPAPAMGRREGPTLRLRNLSPWRAAALARRRRETRFASAPCTTRSRAKETLAEDGIPLAGVDVEGTTLSARSSSRKLGRKAIVVVVAALASGCWFQSAVPDDATILCSDDDDCPPGRTWRG